MECLILMKKIAIAAALALTVGGCMQQSTPQQLNTTNANSRIYIGSHCCPAIIETDSIG